MRLVARPLFNVGVVAIVLGLAQLHAARFGRPTYNLLESNRLVWWLVLLAVLLPTSYAMGLPELSANRQAVVWRTLGSILTAYAAISGFQLLLATPLLPRSSTAMAVLILPLWSLFIWNATGDLEGRAAARDRVFLVVERTEDSETLVRDLEMDAELPASLVGTLTIGAVQNAAPDHLLVEEAEQQGATIVVLDSAAQASAQAVEQAAILHGRGARVRTLSLFYEEWIGKLPHPELAQVSLLFDIGELHRVRYVRTKRVFDVAFAVVGVALLAPIAGVVVCVNAFFNKGPLVYRQDRVGKNGTTFSIFKFRSMVPNDDEATVWTANDDVRITPFGGLLRRSHIDELPQVINILKGDLSLIGPRPEQPTYVEELSEKIAFYDVRHIIRPGLTGWAQVKQGYAADESDAYEKLQYDMYYLRRQGVMLDLRIVWRTVRDVVGARGR